MLKNKHIKFCEHVVNGDSDVEAYLKVYSCSRSMAEKRADELRANQEIDAYIKKRLDEANSKLIMNPNELKMILTDIIRGELTGDAEDSRLPTIKERLEAAKVFAKINGLDVTKAEVSVQDEFNVNIQVIE